MVGVIYIAGGLARMGFVARFFARPVLEGFIVGLGLYIAIGQLPKVVGIKKPSGDTLSVLWNTIADVGSWQWTTVAVGVVALVALFAFARFAPKLPGVIIVVALGILASAALDLQRPRRGDRRRRADRLRVRLAVERLRGRPRGRWSPARSRS